MKRFIVSILSILMFIGISSCQSHQEKDNDINSSLASEKDLNKLKREISDSIENLVVLDSTGVYKSPVIAKDITVTKSINEDYRIVNISFENVSDKNVIAVKFRWKGLDAFGDKADIGKLSDGFGDETIEIDIKSGEKISINSLHIKTSNLRKVSNVIPYEVAFEDGTTWIL